MPAASPSSAAFTSFAERKRDSSASFTGSSAKRSENTLKCCSASSVVGTSTATCLPSASATNAARSATSVLPKPTSPQTSRSIGLPAVRSAITASIAACWSGVSSNGEAVGEGLVVVRRERERVALARRALRVEVQELGGGVVRLPRRALLRLLPLAAAELVQRRGLRRRAAVAADQVQVRDRHVELRVVRVDELQELGRAFAQVQRDEAEVAADAVLLVDDRIADAHLGQVAQHRVDVRSPRAVAPAAAHDARVELGLGDERELRRGPDEAGVHRRHAERDQRLAAEERAEVVDVRQREPVFGEVLMHRLAAAGALGADQHAHAPRGGEEALERGERIVGTAVDLQRRQGCRRSVAPFARGRRPAPGTRCARTASARR